MKLSIALIKTVKITLSLASLMFTACSPTHDNPLLNKKSTSRQVQELLQAPETIVFSDIKRLVLTTRCLDCHGGQETKANVNLVSYDNLTSGLNFKKVVIPFDVRRSELLSTLTASGDRRMPPLDEPQLTDGEKSLLFAWISHGAKNITLAKRPITLKEELQKYFEKPETIDYQIIQKKVFKNQCFKCHSQESELAEDDVLLYSADLTNYQTIFNSFEPVVKKGDIEESALFRSVAIEQSMPLESEGYEPLDSLLVKLLRLWILNCAIESYDPEEEGLISNPKSPDKVRLCEGQ